jgi:hypothetical protein
MATGVEDLVVAKPAARPSRIRKGPMQNMPVREGLDATYRGELFSVTAIPVVLPTLRSPNSGKPGADRTGAEITANLHRQLSPNPQTPNPKQCKGRKGLMRQFVEKTAKAAVGLALPESHVI